MTGVASTRSLTDVLEAHDVAYELIPHRRTLSAAAEARAIGVDPEAVAKTIVLATGDGFLRAVLPASKRIDLRKVQQVLDDRHVNLASEEVLVGAYPDFELGAVPPIGGPGPDPVLVDECLRNTTSVVFEAGTHEQSVRVKTADLVTVTAGRYADICED